MKIIEEPYFECVQLRRTHSKCGLIRDYSIWQYPPWITPFAQQEIRRESSRERSLTNTLISSKLWEVKKPTHLLSGEG
jgi:hypothetical protein